MGCLYSVACSSRPRGDNNEAVQDAADVQMVQVARASPSPPSFKACGASPNCPLTARSAELSHCLVLWQTWPSSPRLPGRLLRVSLALGLAHGKALGRSGLV